MGVISELDPLQTRQFQPLQAAAEDRLATASSQDIESARLHMLATRKALEDYEALKGLASSREHIKLIQVFAKAAQTYLKLSENQR
jgi:hypothetical protein